MVSLNTQFLNFNLINPFILASGPPTATGNMIINAFKAGWAGAVIKTIALEPTPVPCPRLHVIKDGKHKTGFINYELITLLTVDEWCRDIDLIHANFPDRYLIASIMGGERPGDWQEVVNRIQAHGIHAFELNVSCPNYSEERGAQLGQDPEALAMTIQWVKEAAKVPIIVKLTPNVTDITRLAKVAIDAGADAITATNTVSGLGGINLETFQPIPAVEQYGMFGGYSGPSIKPISLRCAASIAQASTTPLLGCGGITRWQDAAEYLAIGATAVQICTSVMWNGVEWINKLTSGLSHYLESHQMNAPHDLYRKALPNIVKFPALNLNKRLYALIDPNLCNHCEQCIRACDSGGFQAISFAENDVVVDRQKCDGCGLCIGICPQSAIHLEPC